jgi:chromosome segregation ATPase
MSKAILIGYLTDSKREAKNSAVLTSILNQLTSIVEEHYDKPPPTQVHIKCPPAIVELATKMEPQIDYKSELEQVQRNCNTIASLHSDLSAKYEEVCKKNEICLNDLDEQEEELDKFKKQVEELETTKQILLVENQRVDKLNRDLQLENVALINDKELVLKTNNDLQEQKKNVSEMFEAANEKQKELQTKLKQINEDYVHLQRSYNHLKETRKAQDVQYNLLQQSYDEVCNERDQLQEQVKNLQATNEELKQMNEEHTYLKSKLENALQENFKLRQAMLTPEHFKVVETSTLENIKKRYNELESTNFRLTQDISQFVQDKEILQESLNRSVEKYDNLRKECLGLQKTINDLLGRIPVNVPTPFDGNN